jgi:hypothetical protein
MPPRSFYFLKKYTGCLRKVAKEDQQNGCVENYCIFANPRMRNDDSMPLVGLWKLDVYGGQGRSVDADDGAVAAVMGILDFLIFQLVVRRNRSNYTKVYFLNWRKFAMVEATRWLAALKGMCGIAERACDPTFVV